MRALAAAIWICAAASAWGQDVATPRAGPFDPPSGPAPNEASIPIAATPARLESGPVQMELDRDGPSGTSRIALGRNLCIDSNTGLPSADSYASLILWPCHGYDNQTATLQGGALLLGAAGTHYVMPLLAPHEGCRPHRAGADGHYEFRICAGPGDFTVVSAAEDVIITSFAAPDTPALTRGAPLFVFTLREGETPSPIWEYDAANRQLRVVGTHLCLTPPSLGVAANAPLYLDDCAAPMQLVRSRPEEAERSRVRFQAAWR